MQHVVSSQAHKLQLWEQHFPFFGRQVEQDQVMDMVNMRNGKRICVGPWVKLELGEQGHVPQTLKI